MSLVSRRSCILGVIVSTPTIGLTGKLSAEILTELPDVPSLSDFDVPEEQIGEQLPRDASTIVTIIEVLSAIRGIAQKQNRDARIDEIVQKLDEIHRGVVWIIDYLKDFDERVAARLTDVLREFLNSQLKSDIQSYSIEARFPNPDPELLRLYLSRIVPNARNLMNAGYGYYHGIALAAPVELDIRRILGHSDEKINFALDQYKKYFDSGVSSEDLSLPSIYSNMVSSANGLRKTASDIPSDGVLYRWGRRAGRPPRCRSDLHSIEGDINSGYRHVHHEYWWTDLCQNKVVTTDPVGYVLSKNQAIRDYNKTVRNARDLLIIIEDFNETRDVIHNLKV